MIQNLRQVGVSRFWEYVCCEPYQELFEQYLITQKS
jgi:hypothetical protein